MASAEFVSAVSAVADLPTSEKAKGYQDLLQQALSSGDSAEEKGENLVTYADSLLSSSGLNIISLRPLLTQLINALTAAPAEVKVRVGAHLSESLQPQVASFEEQDAILRETLADGYEEQEDWSAAAKALQGIHLESTQRQVADVAKVKIWVRIVRCFLEDDDTVSAETALNRIKNSTAAAQVLQTSPDLALHYQLSQARILDSRRDFLNASAEYLQVSNNSQVDEQDRLSALSAAIRTAILAPAGPQRSRTLNKLYKDVRCSETQDYSILENMFLDRLLSPAEVDAFAANLMPHQLAKTADGSTVLSKAVLEHNLIAASHLYENISTASLAMLLGLKDGKDDTAAEKAEDYAARMVEQGRLRAQIDQIAGVITFESVPGVELQGPARELRGWDAGVQGLVEDVERYATAINESFPELAQQVVH